MSIERRMVDMSLEELTTTQGDYEEKVESWGNPLPMKAAPHALTANQLTQMGTRYQDTTHLLLTARRGVTVGRHRICHGDIAYEPTFVNEGGRLAQVFCKVVKTRG